MIFSKCISDNVIPLPTLYLKLPLASLGPVPAWCGFSSLLSGLTPPSSLYSDSSSRTLLVSQGVPIVNPTPPHHFLRETLEYPTSPECPSRPMMSSYRVVHLCLIALITGLNKRLFE